MSDNLKSLLSSNINLPEVEEDDDKNLNRKAEIQYVFLDVIDTIGNETFKPIYMNSIDFIKTTSLRSQRILCSKILEKVDEVYEIKFMENIDLNTLEDMEEVYKLVEFIEYDHVKFVADVWRFLNVNLLKIDIKKYCNDNSTKIIREIDDQLETHLLSKMISEFLRTNIKSVVVNVFAKMTEKSKIDILINVEGGV